MNNFPIELLKTWFLRSRRTLPWREQPTPYRVWISEVMLQQTQVAVVIPYFERWMQLFPTIDALAQAPLDLVIKCWEGLGYYARAKNLHQAANQIVKEFGGELPKTEEDLSKIRGIGRYTQGAIRSFAFRQKAAAVDGNVSRVLSRFLAIVEEIDTSKIQTQLQKYCESILPDQEPWLISEGLIELGATVCIKKPLCFQCPLQRECLAHRHGLAKCLPHKRKRPKITDIKRFVAVIHRQGSYLVQKRPEGGIMANLYEFPYLEGYKEHSKDVELLFEKALDLKLLSIKPLQPQNHCFTRFRTQLYPFLFEAQESTPGHLWKTKLELQTLAFSSGHRKILMEILAT